MTDAKVWLIENITRYERDDRINFLNDCADENGVCIRYVQKCYKELFKPRNNIGTNLIENNNEELAELYPGKYTNVEEDEDIIKESVSLAKKLQKSRDKSRIERKTFRQHARVENACEEYSREIKNLLEEHGFHTYTEEHEEGDEECAGLLHITDWHLNELIDIRGNHFDYKVASRRVKLLADRTIKYFSAFDISSLIIACTGDMLNSDRRADELLSMASNRSKATFLAVDLLKQFIEHLNTKFNITIATVSGNESRVNEEMGFTDLVVTDNYDFTIFNILRYMFIDKPGITFITGDPYELVVNVAGKNILLTHGYNIKSQCEKIVSQIKGRYSDKGIQLDHVIFGHLHSARLGDVYSRGSSLCGANAYSERQLNLSSRASQNIFIIHEDGNMDGIKVDLQDTDAVEGYDIDSSLEAYEAKSSSKLRKQETIIKVVV